MNNYREQTACINCKFAKDHSLDYEWSDIRCSFGLEESRSIWPDGEWGYLRWTDTLPKVDISGICDNYEKGEAK